MPGKGDILDKGEMLSWVLFDIVKQFNHDAGDMEFPDHPDKLEQCQREAFERICSDLVERGIFIDPNSSESGLYLAYKETKAKYVG